MSRSRLGMVARAVLPLALAAWVLATAATAGAATPLASATAIVNPPPQNSLLSLCVTSHTVDPNGTCLTVPSLPPPPSVPVVVSACGGTGGTEPQTPPSPVEFSASLTCGNHVVSFLGTTATPRQINLCTSGPTIVSFEGNETIDGGLPFSATWTLVGAQGAYALNSQTTATIPDLTGVYKTGRCDSDGFSDGSIVAPAFGNAG